MVKSFGLTLVLAWVIGKRGTCAVAKPEVQGLEVGGVFVGYVT